MSIIKSEQPIISNGFVTCYSDRILIRLYYFPFGTKTIKYTNIRKCDLLHMRDLGILQCKLWGMSLSPIWWHSDLSRYGREYYILIDTDQWPKIGITMDDDDTVKVYKLITEKMAEMQNFEKLPEKKPFD